jgi:2-dehydro-3-deoxygalactonokinase
MAAGTLTNAALIAVDWGTSRLRARLVDGNGAILAEAASDEGIGAISGGHEQVIERLTADWPAVPMLMAGMVGSRQGWREVAYVPCPATIAEISRATVPFTMSDGQRKAAIVPGVMLRDPKRDGDVMRGEETQIAGVIEREPAFDGTAILPGTHSKWVRIENGTILDFQSYLTGELFQLLSRQSFLRHSVAENAGELAAAPGFALGVERTAGDDLPFLAALFSVRVRYLLDNADKSDNLAYLSGLVIGGEIAAARAGGQLRPGAAIRVVGAQSLAQAYMKALALIGLAADAPDGDQLALAGLLHIAHAIGFLPKGHA